MDGWMVCVVSGSFLPLPLYVEGLYDVEDGMCDGWDVELDGWMDGWMDGLVGGRRWIHRQ